MEAKSETTAESPTKIAPSTTDKQEAFAHLAQGKRHLLVRDYQEAVTSLGQACKLFSEQYGDTSNECGDAYFTYGKALLELARTESDVLGDAIDGENEDGEEDDDEEGEDNDGNEEANGDEDEVVENGEDGNNDDTKQTSEESKEVTDSESKDNDNPDNEEEESDDDVSNLKLAWEMLELAKIIFQRQSEGNQQLNLKLAEVHLKLGEVGLESENYNQAIEDISSCLQIQLENLQEVDRRIAETHYQLGVAYSMNSDFDKAIEAFSKSVSLIEKRIKNLETRKASGDSCAEEISVDAFYTIDGEIAELKNLLPEMKEKVSDTEDFKRETMKVLLGGMGQRLEGGGASTGNGASSSGATVFGSDVGSSSSIPSAVTEAKPVSNITHLVRKKRKVPEEEPSKDKGTDGEIPPKQTKSE